ncbi:H/ACA ribonucleoprotein complex, subunit Gar1/Naf1 [Corchorus capsularis]|uniref:H/ACA ribonucleoprotein complex non-core subunit NAF1 n=1 Tax=Corchorus capsularis TaxID=210143 RepID=A0A1R3K746_COCAP|nr:H/ACA ribonucleoprotein complex, subunit Gar1/Naf1 [Corchorus capsularis]
MVGFIPDPSPEEDTNQVPKLKNFKDPTDFIDPKTNDLTFADSFLDFDSIKEWFEDNPSLDRICLEESEFGDIKKGMEIGKTHVIDPNVAGFKPIDGGSELVGGISGCPVKVEEEDLKPAVKMEEEDFKPGGKLSPSIAEEMDKVSLVRIKSEEEGNKEKVKVESKTEVDGAYELEEGEIEDFGGEMGVDGTDNSDYDEEDEETYEEDEVAKETNEIFRRSGFEFEDVDVDDEDDDDDAGDTRGPIKSKNEFETLPPVPQVDVTLQPHHQTLPVGVVQSIIGTKVIVEGGEKHNPLNEGSILWITIDRSPLGLVDEIFGPVTNPYYVVRYNSEIEVPAGIHEGTSISFVPEFANHVLNDNNLYKKGYDASGENDEELSDYAEFSDDEKEAEYKKMLKMSKRGTNDQRGGNRKSNKKKVKSRDGAWKNGGNSAQQTSTTVGQLAPDESEHDISTVSASLDSCSPIGRQSFVGGSNFVQPFSVMPQSSGIIPSSNGVWTNGMPGQEPENPIFPNRFPAEGMTMLSQNYQQQPIPLPTPAMPIPYQQQQFFSCMNTLPGMLPGGQPNLFSGPAYAPWMGIGGQNGFGQTSGVGMQGQQLLSAVQSILASGAMTDGNSNVQPQGVPGNFETSQNVDMGNGFSQTTFGAGMQGQQLLSAVQGILASGAMADGNCNVQPGGVPDNFESSQNFNTGASSGRGKRPFHRGRGRGRGRFTGRRDHQQS